MFNNHTMSLVCDLRLIGNEINDIDFITVAAITTGDYPPYPNIYNASILIPPTQILMEWADGNRLVLQNEYPRYLMSKDPDEMITALLAAMTQRNIILYIPKDDFDVFGMILLDHLYFVYGVTCNYLSAQFSIDSSKIPFIMSKFYMIDVMDANEYLNSYPANALLPEFVINKLAQEVHPFNYPATYVEYANYFNSIVASKRQNQQLHNMISVIRGDKK